MQSVIKNLSEKRTIFVASKTKKMKKQNSVRRWAKRTFCLLALTSTAVLTLPSCDKEPAEKAPVYRAPYEKELRFNDVSADSIKMPIVQKFARDTACKHIYLTVTDDNNFTGIATNNISILRNSLNNRIQLAPNKISGRGDFCFTYGAASPADSIWFVQNGWTINQR